MKKTIKTVLPLVVGLGLLGVRLPAQELPPVAVPTVADVKAAITAYATDPSRSAPAVWCGKSGCDAGAAASLLKHRSILFPNRYWTLDALVGKSTAGVGFGWELLPYKEGKPRIFAGPAYITPWRDAGALTFSLGFFAVARW